MSCGKSGLTVLMGFELVMGSDVGSLDSLYIYLYDFSPRCTSDMTMFLHPYPLSWLTAHFSISISTFPFSE